MRRNAIFAFGLQASNILRANTVHELLARKILRAYEIFMENINILGVKISNLDKEKLLVRARIFWPMINSIYRHAQSGNIIGGRQRRGAFVYLNQADWRWATHRLKNRRLVFRPEFKTRDRRGFFRRTFKFIGAREH